MHIFFAIISILNVKGDFIMSNNTTNLSIRMDTELKKQAEQLFAELGMNMTTAFNVFVRQSVRQGGIPFEIKLDVPNAETIAAIDDVNNNRNMSRAFDSVEDFMRDLNA
jgi:DNA-damage-inducible protein J